ncbi:DNA-binding protein WhiA [Pelotomaculum propionicicum]|uniref:Probable cell division protein WhiA n=1 Tax=Pelotomaculum propionicicum TaxID=258475 RepID=A0A4Y7RMK8_9FIRM|nr:DNA-binding protein WhiA [Pelotomaculum propionicicum]NLI14416.1 DNA-binding protein WhiA [Peptococcaceae bacterium]TEB10103.1 Sporulation transcription regulator WhiA [Pelotomaculum propionicicum]
MSFSAVTKSELARVVGQRSCCRLAELAALVKMDGSIQLSGGRQLSLNIITENAAVARKIFSLVKNLFGLQTEVLVQRKNRLKKNNVYLVRFPPQQGMSEILQRLGMLDGTGRLKEIPPSAMLRRDCCRRSYLRGVFLGGGSVNSPEGTYHLEIVTGSEKFAEVVTRLMNRFSLDARTSRRKNCSVIYLKESEHIISFLNIIGAHSALLNFENARIYKGMRNRVNRLVNCETANLNKTVNAAVRQIENIELIRDTLGLDNMPDSLKETAEVRLKYPDACLKELGSLMQPPVGKSCVNHRLRRIEELAEKIRGGKL